MGCASSLAAAFWVLLQHQSRLRPTLTRANDHFTTTQTQRNSTSITMPRAKRNISDVEQSDGGSFIEDDEAPEGKKAKVTKPKPKPTYNSSKEELCGTVSIMAFPHSTMLTSTCSSHLDEANVG